MEFKTETILNETGGHMKLSLGLLQISMSMGKDGKWAIGVNAFSKSASLVCRVEGDDGTVVSTDFPEADRRLREQLQKIRLTPL